MIIINGLAGSTTLIGGVDTAAISDKYANLFAPAGITFAIWGVIYIGLVGFLLRLWGVWSTGKPRLDDENILQLLRWFTASSLLNAVWLLLWQYELLGLSVIVMAALLISLLKMHHLLSDAQLSASESVAIRGPFSIYTGWIMVATIADVTTWLVSAGWDGFGISESTWTVIMLLAGGVIATTTALVRYDGVLLTVFVWAYFGILYKHLSVFDNHYGDIIITLAIVLPVFVVLAILLLTKQLSGYVRSR